MIRLAKAEDVPKLVDYGEQFWHQTNYFKAGVDYSRETVTAMTEQLIDNGIVIYAEDHNKVIGLMLVIIAPFPMNDDFEMAVEWVFYVDEEYRQNGLGVTLIKSAEAILINKRIKFFTMVSLTNGTPDTATRLYQSLGFNHWETSYTKELSWPP